jgi:acyl carrier protein
MGGTDNLTRVNTVIADVLGVNAKDIHPDDSFIENFAADGHALFGLLETLGEEFGGLSFSDDDRETLRTVGDLHRLVEAKQKALAAV